MIRVENMQLRALLAGPPDAVADRHEIIAPPVHDRYRAADTLRRVLLEPWHIERRRHQKECSRRQARCGRGRNVPAETRTDEHERRGQRCTDRQELLDALARIVDAPIIDRFDLQSELT